MTVDWRILAEQLPSAILIDVDAYAIELDAVDASVRASHIANGGPGFMSPFGWGDAKVQNGTVIKVEKRPVVPVRAEDPSRVAVAVFQRLVLAWHRRLAGLGSCPCGSA